MSKNLEQWSATVPQLASSAKRNRGITDYITPGFVFMTAVNDSTQTPGSQVVANHGGSQGSITDIPLIFSVGLVPYNPATSLWDRMIVVAKQEIGFASAADLRYQLPGAGVVVLSLADPLPVAITIPSQILTSSSAEGAEVIDLSGVATAGWIHITWDTHVSDDDAFSYFVWGMLYSSKDDPF